MTSIDALLATIVPLHRDVVSDPRRRVRMGDWSRGWSDFGLEIGIECPASLLQLARTMKDIDIYIDDEHGWELLVPTEARRARTVLGELTQINPCLARFHQMMPVFGQDGDLLLLAADGTTCEVSHESLGDVNRDFPSFDAMLDALVAGMREKRSEG